MFCKWTGFQCDELPVWFKEFTPLRNNKTHLIVWLNRKLHQCCVTLPYNPQSCWLLRWNTVLRHHTFDGVHGNLVKMHFYLSTVPYNVLTNRSGLPEWQGPRRVCSLQEVLMGWGLGPFATHTHTYTHSEAMSCAVRHPKAVLRVPCQGGEMICESWENSRLMCTELSVPVQPG